MMKTMPGNVSVDFIQPGIVFASQVPYGRGTAFVIAETGTHHGHRLLRPEPERYYYDASRRGYMGRLVECVRRGELLGGQGPHEPNNPSGAPRALLLLLTRATERECAAAAGRVFGGDGEGRGGGVRLSQPPLPPATNTPPVWCTTTSTSRAAAARPEEPRTV